YLRGVEQTRADRGHRPIPGVAQGKDGARSRPGRNSANERTISLRREARPLCTERSPQPWQIRTQPRSSFRHGIRPSLVHNHPSIALSSVKLRTTKRLASRKNGYGKWSCARSLFCLLDWFVDLQNLVSLNVLQRLQEPAGPSDLHLP